MLLRLAYLAVTNTFALLRLLPMSERDKDIEILALRHRAPRGAMNRVGVRDLYRAKSSVGVVSCIFVAAVRLPGGTR